MARSTKPRVVRTRPKPLTTTDPFPTLQHSGGVGIGALELKWRRPAAQIRQWITNGLLHQNPNGTIAPSEVRRFTQEHADLLA